MRNTTLSRLALLGLATVSSLALAANTVNGEIRFDARFTTSQKNNADVSVGDANEAPDNLFISRARLDMQGDVAKNWTYGLRLEVKEFENSQLNLEPSGYLATYGSSDNFPFLTYASFVNDMSANFARAYVTWSGIENINISFGRIGCPEITSDRLYYKPFIGQYPNNTTIGTVVSYAGDHAGFSIDGKAGPVGYSFGVWQQTNMRNIDSLPAVADALQQSGSVSTSSLAAFQSAFVADADAQFAASNYNAKSLRLGYGGRLSFAHKMNASTSYGIGIGYNQAPLNAPVAVITVGQLGATSGSSYTQPTYSISSFNHLQNYAVDGSAVFGAFQVNVGYEWQTLKNDTNALYNSNSSYNAAAQVFNEDGKANAFWIEGGYLIMGDSYKFDAGQAVVSGVKLRENQAGLEIVARYGKETRQNVLALLNHPGNQDFNTSGSPIQAANPSLLLASVNHAGSLQNALELFVDNSQSGQIVASDDVAFEEKVTGYAIGLNYYLCENAVIKAEYEQRNYEFQRMASGSAYVDSLNYRSVQNIRLRADYSF
ncbi:MAG: hypothetical protein FJ161_02675 [Gammaproteobacteria bacterium]|nr:hypothetical protein [Gammaproteobacteria bacterium]